MKAITAALAAWCAVHLGLLATVAAAGWDLRALTGGLLVVLVLLVRSRRRAGAECC